MRKLNRPLIIISIQALLALGVMAIAAPRVVDYVKSAAVDVPWTNASLEEPAPVMPAHSPASDAFHFLPPFGAGGGDQRRFDPSLLNYLSVEICEVAGSDCSSVRTFTSNGPEQIRITGHHFNVNFNAGGANLSNLATYRLRVIAADLLLGSIDVTPGMRGGLGRTWPIKFLVESDPAIRVRVLRFRKQSASQIVNALRSEFNLCGQEAAELLANDLRPFSQAEIDVAISGVCQDVVVPDTTKVADEATRNALISYEGTTGRMVFADSTDVLRNLKRGDVFVSEPSEAAPYGYLRKITAISRIPGQIILGTVQAKLNEAIYKGTLNATGELLPNDGTQPSELRSGTSMEKGQLPPASNIVIDEGDVFNFHRDIDVTINFNGSEDGVEGTGTVRVTGFVYFNAGYNVGIGIRECLAIPPACPDRFEAWAGLEQKSRLRVTGNFDGKLTKEKTIYPIPMEPILFFIGPIPVVLVPEVNVKLGVNGEAHVDFVFEGDAKSKFKAGAKWLNPDYGGNGWNNISEFTPFEKNIHSADINAKMYVEAYAKADAKIKLYGIAGPGIDGSVGILLDADSNRKPFWFMKGHIRTNVYFEASIADIIELGHYSTPILNEYLYIAESPNSPPIFSNVKTDTIFADVGRPLTLGPRSGFAGYFDVVDPEGDVPQLTARSDVDGDIPLTYAFQTAGVRRITVTARDAEGADSSITLIVEVRNSLPIVAISAGTTVPATVQFFIAAEAFDPDTSAFLPCSRFNWPVPPNSTVTVLNDGGGCNAVIRFAQPGNYTVTVTATDFNGGVGTNSIVVAVTPRPTNLPPEINAASFHIRASSGRGGAPCFSGNQFCTLPDNQFLWPGFGQQAADEYAVPIFMTVEASDPEGDQINYQWRCEAGAQSVVGTYEGNNVYKCTPPYVPGVPIKVYAIVSDGTFRPENVTTKRTYFYRVTPN